MPKAQVFLEKPKSHYPNCTNTIKIGDENFEYDEVFSSSEDINKNVLEKCIASFIHGQSIVVIGTDTNEKQASYTNAIFNGILKSTSSLVRYYKNDINESDIIKIKDTLKSGDEVCLCSIKEFTPEFISSLETLNGDIYEQFKESLTYVHFNNSTSHRRLENSEQLFTFRLIKHIDYCLQDSILYYTSLNTSTKKSPLLLNTLPVLHNLILSDKLGVKPISDNKGILINALYERTSATYIVVKLDPIRLKFEDVKRIHYFTCRDYSLLNDFTYVQTGDASVQSLNNKIVLLSEKLRKERKDHAIEKESMELILRKDIVNEVLANHKDYLHSLGQSFENALKETLQSGPDISPAVSEDILTMIKEIMQRKLAEDATKANIFRAKSTQTDVACCDNVYEVNELEYRLKKFNCAFKVQYSKLKECQQGLVEQTKASRDLKQILAEEKASKSYLASQVLLLQESSTDYKRQLEEKIGEIAEQRVSHTNEVERLRAELRDSHLELRKANLAKDEMNKKHADEVRSLRNLYHSNYSPVPSPKVYLHQIRSNKNATMEEETTMTPRKAPVVKPHITAEDDYRSAAPTEEAQKKRATTRVTRSAKKPKKEK